tara:strand:+ start:184 stop:438 length:255 start_codon:yes stop_codon:yes gene_type:complete
MDKWYKNPVTGERIRVDSQGNLYAPLISGVDDENIDAIRLRMKVNAGSGIGAFWGGEDWHKDYLIPYKETPIADVPKSWKEVLI